jgi:predicted peroxiredoxin
MMRLIACATIDSMAGLLMLTAGCVSAHVESTPTVQEPTADAGVFIHICSGPADAHKVLMALKMADLMADDHDVLVYFDVAGVDVVLKDAPDITHRAFDSSKQLLDRLLKKGVPLYACPTCLAAAGKTQADLLPGVQIANKPAFFGFTNGRMLTLDY